MLNKFPDVMNVEDMCKALNIGVSYAYKLLNSGEIQGFRAGKIWKINKESVIEFIRRERIPRPQQPEPVPQPQPLLNPVMAPWQDIYATSCVNVHMTQPYTYMAPAQQKFLDEMNQLKQQVQQGTPEQAAPRRRGRPRKHPLPEQQPNK